jgi:hypothetical protein
MAGDGCPYRDAPHVRAPLPPPPQLHAAPPPADCSMLTRLGPSGETVVEFRLCPDAP